MADGDGRPDSSTAALPTAPTVAAQPDASVVPQSDPATTRRARHPRLQHYLRGLNHLGVVLGLLGLVCSLSPSLLPRSWQLQGVVSGLSWACAYGIGVVLAWVCRRAGVPKLAARTQRIAWYAIAALSAVVIPVMLWLSSAWQNDVRRAVGMGPAGRYLYVGVLVIAAATAAVLLGLTRLVYDTYRSLVTRLLRHVPVVAARLIAFTVVGALVVGLLTGLVYRGLVNLANATFSTVDHGTAAQVVRPASPLRSGSPASLLSWSTLGKEGRSFVGTGPTPTEIRDLTGRPATEPIRVYAGLASSSSLQGEADMVLSELKRTDAFGRAVLALAGTTGSGWVDPRLADPLEYMFGGNTAIAAIQFSYLPSWIAFLADKGRARAAGRVLFNTIYDYWAELPKQRRPRLVVFGESLGAFGSSAAFSGVADLTIRTNAALFVGTPNVTELWREVTNRRTSGSPERLPVYGDGRTVVFAAGAADLRNPDGTLRQPKVVFVQHASDPVVWWSPDLIWTKPAWLREKRGADVAAQMRWFPIVTFWQLTCDMAISLQPPPGHGHSYGPEIPTAWAALLHPPGWTDTDTVALTTVIVR